jgi:hypothetical protein
VMVQQTLSNLDESKLLCRVRGVTHRLDLKSSGVCDRRSFIGESHSW